MLTILCSEHKIKSIEEDIGSIQEFKQLIKITTEKSHCIPSKMLIIRENSIEKPADWFDNQPPYLIPKIEYSKNNIIALLYFCLMNYQKAIEYTDQSSELYEHLFLVHNIQKGNPISKKQYKIASQSKHNTCIIHQYGNYSNRLPIDELVELYKATIKSAPTNDLMFFSAKHYINLLIGIGALKDAEIAIRSIIDRKVTKEARVGLELQLGTVIMRSLQEPFNLNQIKEIHQYFKSGISYYESKSLFINAGLLLVDTSELSKYQRNFIEAERDIDQAIIYFTEANTNEFLGEAQIRRANLLYFWAKTGNNETSSKAIEAMEMALNIFPIESHPKKHADIYHNMALMYSDLSKQFDKNKVENTLYCYKKAVEYYTKIQHPYDYAIIVHNLANTLKSYVKEDIFHDFVTINKKYEEVLEIRTPEIFSAQRAITLLDQIDFLVFIQELSSQKNVNYKARIKSKLKEVKNLKLGIEYQNRIKIFEEKIT